MWMWETLTMRTCLALVALLLGAPCGSEQPASDAATVVSYAKKIDVATLDPALQSQPLDEWLRLGVPRIERLEWHVSDCDLKPDYAEPPSGYPLCVKVVYHRSRVSGWIIITIGTRRDGIVEPPRFEYAVISTRSANGVRFENAKKLSDLPPAMTKLLAEE